MFSPEIITYTFYEDEQDCLSRKNKLLLEEKRFETNSHSILNLSKKIMAFSLIYGGDSVSVPLCNEKYLGYANSMLNAGLIDAYCAGKKFKNDKSKWFYEGCDLAILILLAEKSGIQISDSELRKTLAQLRNSSSQKSINLVSGFDKDDFITLLSEVSFDYVEKFNFVYELKKKYRKNKWKRYL